MSNQLIAQVEAKLNELISRHQQLVHEHQGLLEQQAQWEQERSRLVEKNTIARQRVEAMIDRLKSLESNN